MKFTDFADGWRDDRQPQVVADLVLKVAQKFIFASECVFATEVYNGEVALFFATDAH